MSETPAGDYARVTVLVTRESYRYLQRCEQEAGASFADTIDRSLETAAYLDDQVGQGGELLLALNGLHYPIYLSEPR